jgi:peroxiredoxin
MLKTPLALPPTLLEELGAAAGRTTLVNLWAHWCEPCAEEVRTFAARLADLETRSIRWSPVSLDAPDDHAAAVEWLRQQLVSVATEQRPPVRFLSAGSLRTLEAVLAHVTGRAGALPIPANLLVDAKGRLQLLYFGSIFPDRFLSDAGNVLDPARLASRRSLRPGRWYYRSRRDLAELGRNLAEAGRMNEAGFYLEPQGKD